MHKIHLTKIIKKAWSFQNRQPYGTEVKPSYVNVFINDNMQRYVFGHGFAQLTIHVWNVWKEDNLQEYKLSMQKVVIMRENKIAIYLSKLSSVFLFKYIVYALIIDHKSKE